LTRPERRHDHTERSIGVIPSHRWFTTLTLAVGVLIALGAPPSLHAQQEPGTIRGTVINAETGQPVEAVQISVVGTQRGTLTDARGMYIVVGVPAGAHQVRAQYLGFGTITQPVQLAAGQTATVDFGLRFTVLDMGEIVVTGVAGEVERAKLPFTVDQLKGEDIPVSRLNVGSALQGKVAGVQVVSGSGRPGSAPSILLRGATSIVASGRSQDPLYIVDGVILSASVVDIDALDIESIEVVKGAAAASLYGSRAAAGVIQIRTSRGSQYADGQVRYNVKTTFGVADLPGRFRALEHHAWALTPDGSRFIDRDGNACTFRGTPSWDPNNECPGTMRFAGQLAGPGETPSQWNSIANQPWPDGIFDQVGRHFDGGLHQEHYISAAGRQGATNFLVSASFLDDQGPMLNREGQQRTSLRLNLDQMVTPGVKVSTSAFYSRSTIDNSEGDIFALTRMQAGVDLQACEPVRRADGTWERRPGTCIEDPRNLLLNVNPTNLESQNPLYGLLVQERSSTRGRFLGSANVRWTPVQWVDLETDVSYDRLDADSWSVNPKGYRTLTPGPANEGYLSIGNTLAESVNASATALFRWRISDRINNRTRLRYLYEVQDVESNSVYGGEFGVRDVPTVANTNPDRRTGGNSQSRVVSDGYFLISTFDLYDRYILDGLVRNDGSSLFGADERRQWYYRLGGAWRLSQEDWFNVGAIDELKFRFSQGTAGGRPYFSAQYETFSVVGGVPVPVNLGNRNLKPEHSVENEAGVDLAFLNRFALSLTYANTETSNQIMSVPLPAFLGFSSQVQNVGTLESKTWEATFDASLIRTPEFSWSARLLYDQTRTVITKLNRPPFRFANFGGNAAPVFLAREGERYGSYYGNIAASKCSDLPAGTDCSHFAVNDDGLLVWVGPGGSLSDNKWGQGAGFSIQGLPVLWGAAIRGECDDPITGGKTTFCKVGETIPDFALSASTNLQWKGLSVYALFESLWGFDIFDMPTMWAVFVDNSGIMDQSGKPAAAQKPVGYYKALYDVSGLSNANQFFMEDGSYIKLRELSLRYQLRADQLARVPGLSVLNGAGLSLSGRNLFTWTDYPGFDPETGGAGGATGSAAIARVDGYRYPNFRTWTFTVDLTF
jgi:TonB-linked SusC/RagA family outer membrane protein